MSEQPEAEVAPAPVRKNKAQKPNLSDDQIIEQILGKMPTTEEVSVNLPSNNKFYKLMTKLHN